MSDRKTLLLPPLCPPLNERDRERYERAMDRLRRETEYRAILLRSARFERRMSSFALFAFGLILGLWLGAHR